MSYSAQAVANAFVKIAQESKIPVTNMKLQKMVSIAHGFSLATLNEPLTYSDVQAWQYGPVYPERKSA